MSSRSHVIARTVPSIPLITGSNSRNALSVQGFDVGDSADTTASANDVGAGFFRAMAIPLLDGGHLLFLMLELIQRKPVSVRVREYASIFGLTVLILLMVFAFKNDVERQWPELFQSRSGE